MATTLIIEDLLAQWVLGLPSLQGVVKAVAPWQRVDQGTPRPYVAYQLVHGDRLRSTHGPTTGVSIVRIQLDVVSRSYAESKQVAAVIRDALETQLPRQQLGGVASVQSARVKGRRDAVSVPEYGDQTAETRETIEVTIWFQERG